MIKCREGMIITMNEISFSLKKYRLECLKIDGAETHIIDLNSMEALVNDHQLLAQMGIERKYLMPYIDVISSVREVELYLSIVYNERFKVHQCFPVLCLRWNNRYHHVVYDDRWYCRNCRHEVERVLRHFSESSDGGVVYSDHEYPPIPMMFQKINCPQCGEPLQCHLMLLGRYV